MEFNLADLYEIVADAVPARPALVAGDRRLTYAQLDERANRFAHHLLDHGIEPGDKVAIYSWDRAEWVEAMLGTYKARAVPINVNYRYVADEVHYILDNSDAVTVVFERAFAPVVNAVRADLPKLRHSVVLEDGTDASTDAVPYEDALATGSPARVFEPRSPDDLYLLYTGGTTGVPKGVMWRSEDIFFAALGGGGFGQPPITKPEELSDRIPAEEALAAPGTTYDTSSIIIVGSGGAILSPPVKDQLRAQLPNAMIMDSFGASETGASGTVFDTDGPAAGPRFTMGEFMTVLDDELRPVEPGSGVVGRLARRGHIPLGYYKDDAKTAATFVTAADGARWVVPGDFAVVETDVTITVLGRGSVCINSGGEKVYPEEVEAALKSHPDVFDAVVVGVPDDRYVERVAAIVQARPGAEPSLEELQDHGRDKLAGYKLPRQLLLAETIPRTPVGKPDYRAAKKLATSEHEDEAVRSAL